MSQNAPWQIQDPQQHQQQKPAGQVQMFDPTQFNQQQQQQPQVAPATDQQQDQSNLNGDGWDNSWNWGEDNQQQNTDNQQQYYYDQQQQWNNYYAQQQQYNYSSEAGHNYGDSSGSAVDQNSSDASGQYNTSWNNVEPQNQWGVANEQQWYNQQGVADGSYGNNSGPTGGVGFGDQNMNNVDQSVNYQYGFQGANSGPGKTNHVDDSQYDDEGTAATFFGKDDDFTNTNIQNSGPTNQQMEDINLNDDSTAEKNNDLNQSNPDSTSFIEDHSRQSSYGGGASFVIGSGPNSRRASALPDDVQSFTPAHAAEEVAHTHINNTFQNQSPYDPAQPPYHPPPPPNSYQQQTSMNSFHAPPHHQSHTSVDSIHSDQVAVLNSFAIGNSNNSRPASAVEQNTAQPALFNPLMTSQSLPTSPYPASRKTPTSPASYFHQQPAANPPTESGRSRNPSSHSTKSQESAVASSIHSDSVTSRSPASTPYSGSLRGPSPLTRDMSPVQKIVTGETTHHHNPTRSLPAMQAVQEHGSESNINDISSSKNNETQSATSQPVDIPQHPTDLPLSQTTSEHAMSIYHSPIQPHPNSLFRPVSKVVTPTSDSNPELAHSVENVAQVHTSQPMADNTQSPASVNHQNSISAFDAQPHSNPHHLPPTSGVQQHDVSAISNQPIFIGQSQIDPTPQPTMYSSPNLPPVEPFTLQQTPEDATRVQPQVSSHQQAPFPNNQTPFGSQGMPPQVGGVNLPQSIAPSHQTTFDSSHLPPQVGGVNLPQSTAPSHQTPIGASHAQSPFMSTNPQQPFNSNEMQPQDRSNYPPQSMAPRHQSPFDQNHVHSQSSINPQKPFNSNGMQPRDTSNYPPQSPAPRHQSPFDQNRVQSQNSTNLQQPAAQIPQSAPAEAATQSANNNDSQPPMSPSRTSVMRQRYREGNSMSPAATLWDNPVNANVVLAPVNKAENDVQPASTASFFHTQPTQNPTSTASAANYFQPPKTSVLSNQDPPAQNVSSQPPPKTQNDSYGQASVTNQSRPDNINKPVTSREFQEKQQPAINLSSQQHNTENRPVSNNPGPPPPAGTGNVNQDGSRTTTRVTSDSIDNLQNESTSASFYQGSREAVTVQPGTPQQQKLDLTMSRNYNTPDGGSQTSSTPARSADRRDDDRGDDRRDRNEDRRDDDGRNRDYDRRDRGNDRRDHSRGHDRSRDYSRYDQRDRRDEYNDRDHDYRYRPRTPSRDNDDSGGGRDRPRTPSREDSYSRRPTTPSREYDYDRRYSESRDRWYDRDYYDRYGERPSSRQSQDNRDPYERPRSRQGEVELQRSPSRGSQSEMDRPRSRGAYDDYYRDYYRQAEYDRYYGYGSRSDSRYYDDRYYEDYYNYQRQDRYNRGYYEEMQYYGQQYADDRYRDYYRGIGSDRGSQYSSSHSRGATPAHSRGATPSHSRGATPSLLDDESLARPLDYRQQSYEQPQPQQAAPAQQRSRPSSRQSYHDEYDGYYRRDDYQQSRSLSYDSYGEQVWQQSKQTEGRMTPVKYAMPHMRVCFGPCGQLIKVLPNRPVDGQPATVEIHDLESMFTDTSEVETLRTFPGPLVNAETHKNDVLSFCRHHVRMYHENISMVDRSSAELLWKYLELLIKQNGTVIGTDIAELLLDGHMPSSDEFRRTGIPIVMSHANLQDLQASGMVELQEDNLVVTSDRSVVNPAPATTKGQLSIDAATDRFRHLLLYGRKKDALESAVKNHLWGHALFLASKMDNRTYANILTRFANNSMKMNDPLQTLYQIMSGRQPSAVTGMSDDRWGDWRPHLAMILSNQSVLKPELDKKSISALGDTLASRGCLHASHFCYLMAQHSFGSFLKKTSKLVLIGSSHVLSFNEFASNDAIQCTEIYEYAVALGNSQHVLYHFQPYKFIYAARLAEAGLSQEALHYCEVIANTVVSNPAVYNPVFVKLLFELSSRLKYSDQNRMQYGVFEDPVWLQRLAQVIAAFDDGTLQPVSGVVTPGYSSTTANSSEAGDVLPPDSTQTEQDYYNQQQQQQQQQGYYGYYNQDGTNQQQQQQQWAQYYNQQQQQTTAVGDQQTDPTQQQQQQQQQDWQQWQQQQQGQYYDGQYYNQYQQPPQTDQPQTDTQYQQQGTDNVDSAGQNVNLGSSMNSNYTATSATSDNSEETLGQSPEAASSFDYYGASQPQFSKPQMNLPPLSISNSTTTASSSPQELSPGASTPDTVTNGVSSPMSLSRKSSVASTISSSLDRQMAMEAMRRLRQTSVGSNSSRYSQSPPGSSPGSPVDKTPPGSLGGTNSELANTTPSNQSNSQAGWFGGFFNRFATTKKNEMKLPDDKNPTIIWDPVKKRWTNVDGDEEDETVAAPPPKDIDLMRKTPAATNAGAASSQPTPGAPPLSGNRFARPKVRGARGQYVDVLKGSSTAAPAAPASLFNVMPSSAATPAMPSLFVPAPAPVGDMSGASDVNLPSPGAAEDNHQIDPSAAAQPSLTLPQSEFANQHSRSSSMSSVSQEVQSITQMGQQQQAPPMMDNTVNSHPTPSGASQPPASGMGTGPFMFNPAQFSNTPQTTFPAPASGGANRLKYGARRAYPK